MGLLTAIGGLFQGQGEAPNALQRFGVQLDPTDQLNYMEAQPKILQMQNLQEAGRKYQAGEITQPQYLQMIAMQDPMAARQLAGINQPSSLQELASFQNMTPDQKKVFWNIKRSQLINQGNQFGQIDPETGSVIPVAPINLKPEDQPANAAAKAAATTAATKTAEAETNALTSLPDFSAAADTAINTIDQMIGNKEKGIPEHPGLSGAVGPISSRLPTVSGDTADFESLLGQVQSEAFLQSIKQMQGFGALSNQEGERATNAATRMKTAQSEAGFRKAAFEYRDIVAKGVERMKQKASGNFSGASSQPPATPKTISFGDLK